MLQTCPECELPVSDKAITCPHCGYPLDKVAQLKTVKKPSKRMRLPNGFGRITEIHNQTLRKPFRAMVSVGKNEYGKPIGKILGYYKTYNDAYYALTEYNKNPYDLGNDLTMQELYDRWTEKYFPTLSSDSSKRTIKSAWSRCSNVMGMKVSDIRARHLKGIIEAEPSSNMQGRIKSTFNLMLDFAVEYELTDHNYARDFKVGEKNIGVVDNKQAHLTFTQEEMEVLWANVKKPYVDIILIQCYMGWRPQELGLIELKNVSVEEHFIIGGMKTESGRNRQVPIHPKIANIIQARYAEAKSLGSEYLLNCTDTHTNHKLTYDKYRHRFENIIEELGLNKDHRPHDPRKHFITMCKQANVDEYAIKYMAGHRINDITEKVYTERHIEWLISEIGKI